MDLLGFSDTHRRSVKYALKLTGIVPTTDDHESAKMAILKHVHTHKKTTLVQVAVIVKSTNPIVYKDLVKDVRESLNVQNDTHKQTHTTNVHKMSRSTHDAIEQFILQVARDPYFYFRVASPILMCICTNLRISEMIQLTRKHVESIRNGDTVPIDVKKKKRLCRIAIIKSLFNKYYDIFIETPRVVNVPISTLNKLIRSNLLDRGANPIDRCGIQCIRAYNTTRLLSHIDIYDVARFNRHKRIDTIQKHYNTGMVLVEKDFENFV